MMPTDLPYRPCVGVMLINPEKHIFVGERIDTPDAWQMPQGGIDEGEDPLEAALRELVEETGIPSTSVEVVDRTSDWLTYDLPPQLLGKVWKGKFRGQKQLWYLLRLNGEESLIDLQTEHPEFARWKWSDKVSLVEEIVPFKKEIYEKVVSSFEQHL